MKFLTFIVLKWVYGGDDLCKFTTKNVRLGVIQSSQNSIFHFLMHHCSKEMFLHKSEKIKFIDRSPMDENKRKLNYMKKKIY